MLSLTVLALALIVLTLPLFVLEAIETGRAPRR